MAREYQEYAAFANDPRAVRVELLGGQLLCQIVGNKGVAHPGEVNKAFNTLPAGIL